MRADACSHSPEALSRRKRERREQRSKRSQYPLNAIDLGKVQICGLFRLSRLAHFTFAEASMSIQRRQYFFSKKGVRRKTEKNTTVFLLPGSQEEHTFRVGSFVCFYRINTSSTVW